MSGLNYARHVGAPARTPENAQPWQRKIPAIPSTGRVVFFTGNAPEACFPLEQWAFWRLPHPHVTPFAGKLIGEPG